MTVLVADDDALQRETLANALGGWGYDVEAVADGSAAWSRLEAGGVHLVLTDWQMPGLDGAALCRRIRAAAPGRYVCVLLLTAHTDPDGAVRALEAGADDYLAKPVRRSELQARVAAGARVVAQEERLAAQADALAAAHHRLQDDLAAAATLQRRHVLAGRHEADGFAVEGLFRPAATVGGDVFQAARLGDRHLAFYLFDVAGHGVRAAMWAVGAAMALQPGAGLVATADGSPRRPGDVLADLNRHLANDVSDYLTGIYALADLEAGTVTFAQAGHPPPLVV
ncbi:MAG: response regulator, partial [Bacteroidota bacterium]